MERYINREKLSGINKLLITILVVFGILLLPLIIILISGIEDGEPHTFVTVLVLLLIMLAEAGSFAYFASQSNRAKRYGPIFEEDHDGIISFERISQMTGCSIPRVKKDIAFLINKGVILNARVENENVILGTSNDYSDVTCPTCGAVNSVRLGSSAKCKHCGSYLRRA